MLRNFIRGTATLAVFCMLVALQRKLLALTPWPMCDNIRNSYSSTVLSKLGIKDLLLENTKYVQELSWKYL